MAKITALFFDIGGVILTNTWGHESRRRAAVQFQLDGNEFERLHEPALSLWETGQIGFDDYLDRAVFNRPRAFSREVFKDFMLEQSQAFPETLAILAALAESKKYLISALNNESREMNQHRIERFELRNYFTVFFSSCYLGVRKPDEAIYRAALLMSQRAPEECVFIDDREVNVEPARRLGMSAIHYQAPVQLQGELAALGVQT